jgi:hypothetical protein
MKNVIGSALIFVGFFLVIGAAGSDCDGDCMENALSLSELLVFTSVGLCGIIAGSAMCLRSNV